jgi:multidrug resistance efflux pump
MLSPQAESAAQAEPPGVKVKLAAVETGTLEESSDYIASLQSRRSVTLQPRIQGQVSQIFVRAGTQVAAGTVIMQVDAAEQQAAASGISAAAQAATAELENARATLRSLQAERLSNLSDVRLNQQDYQRYSGLASQGAVSRQTQEQYNNRLQSARASLGSINAQIQAQEAAVSQAEKALLQAQANIKEQQVELQYYRISAPIGGTVGDIPVKVGDFVNTATPLTTITQNRPLEVNISVPIERSPQLRIGMPVEIMNAQGQACRNE